MQQSTCSWVIGREIIIKLLENQYIKIVLEIKSWMACKTRNIKFMRFISNISAKLQLHCSNCENKVYAILLY
jgi:hypothetical protein